MPYSKEIYRCADMKLEQLRTKNAEILRNRKKEIYSLFPEYKAKKEKLMDIIGKILEAGADKSKTAEIKKEVAAIENELEQILKSNGYRADYLDEIISCGKCRDRGYVLNRRCSCYDELLKQAAREHSNLKYIMDKKTLANFDIGIYSDIKIPDENISPRENIKYVYAEIKKFVNDFNSESCPSLLFTGNIGLGKTFAASVAANLLIERGKSVFYQSASKFFEILEDYKFNRRDTAYDIMSVMEDINSCDLLIIDDLGSEFSTSYTVSAVYETVNKRLIDGKKMIITTNLDIKGLSEYYTTRLSSRIIGNFEILEFIGEDLRINNME